MRLGQHGHSCRVGLVCEVIDRLHLPELHMLVVGVGDFRGPVR